jgi:hypothetical protein
VLIFLLLEIGNVTDLKLVWLGSHLKSQVLKRKAPLDQVKYWLKGEDAKKTEAHAVGAGENIWMVA